MRSIVILAICISLLSVPSAQRKVQGASSNDDVSSASLQITQDTSTTKLPISTANQEPVAEELDGIQPATSGRTGCASNTLGSSSGSFLCKDGTSISCTLNGKRGIRECTNGRFGSCIVEGSEPTGPIVTGTVRPKYYILSVIFAPPGTKGGNISSSVRYGSGSTTGTTVSSGSSFKHSHAVSVSAQVGILTKIGLEASYEFAKNKSKSESLDIKKSAASEINMPGPSIDGIDHDRDQIWLWLNPTISLTLTPKSASWTLDSKREAFVTFVFAGHLKDPSRMPPGVAQTLRTHGITAEDFPEILKADPFVGRRRPLVEDVIQPLPIEIDAQRFKPLPTTFPYEPPFAQGDKATTLTFTITNSTTSSSTSSIEKAHTVGVTISGESGFLSLFKVSVKNANKWTWTNSSTNSNLADAKESAAVTVGGPAFGYTGPTNMRVYYDVLYKTFLFVPIEQGVEPVLQGALKSSSGKVVAGKEVVVVANGKKFRTFTNAKGEYRIFDRISGQPQLQVDGIRKDLTPLQPRKKADMLLP